MVVVDDDVVDSLRSSIRVKVLLLFVRKLLLLKALLGLGLAAGWLGRRRV